LVAAFVLPAVPSHADDASGCDFAPNGTTLNCVGPLSGSTFAGGDGNLKASPTSFGATDWDNVAGLNVGIDRPSGSGDNSFGQGTKEDGPAVTVVSGSIPPNKSDLTRFYEASETVNSQTYLYLAWERSNVLGNANMDFEIDQKATTGLTGSFNGGITLNRQPGDMLVTFDFTNGGGRPVLGLNRWLVSSSSPTVTGFATNTCFSANSFPCWGDHLTLNGADSEGAVNSFDAVTDPIASTSMAAGTFGETAINLTAAGVFGTNTCNTFATTFLKSRASSSFTAEVKDFVAPVPTNISNCGRVTIIKHTDPTGINQNFSYTSTLTGAQITGGTLGPCATPAGFTLNDHSSSTNTEDCVNVPAGNYTVTETGTPPATSFVLESLTCSATGTGASGTQHATGSAQADITLTPLSHVTCTYINQQQLGAIKITKTSSKAAATPLQGAVFTIKSGGTSITGSPFTTDANGSICVDHLPFGTYAVQEKTAPSGYSIDDSTAHNVSVKANSTCRDGNEASIGFTDTPLTDITASATSEVPGGTQTKITCIDSNSANVGNSPQGYVESPEVTANGLAPGTYTCTIIVDP
jgi:hypothetical protein